MTTAARALPIGLAPRLQVIAAAALFSTGGVAIKGLALSSWQVAGLRSGIAAAALALMLPAGRRTLARHGLRPGLIGVGMAYGATLVLFVLGNKLTTAANTIFLQSTAPLYVLLLAPWLLAEPVRRRDVAYMAALAVGLGLFFVGQRVPDALAPDPFTGNLVAVASGVTWALTLLGLRRLGRSVGVGGGTAATAAGAGAGRPSRAGRAVAADADLGAAAVLLGNLFACAFALPLALGDSALLRQASAGDWVVLAYLGVIQIGLAYVLLTRAFRRIGALEAALLLLVEPVLNPIWTWLVHGEGPGGWALAGGAVILAATAVKAVFDARRARVGRQRSI
ncbi:MAG TPA: DMT family transporter [Thermoanaerobaculia bacterium]|nr:DMT family transporter [Thermoanaerobaculia bacterium]